MLNARLKKQSLPFSIWESLDAAFGFYRALFIKRAEVWYKQTGLRFGKPMPGRRRVNLAWKRMKEPLHLVGHIDKKTGIRNVSWPFDHWINYPGVAGVTGVQSHHPDFELVFCVFVFSASFCLLFTSHLCMNLFISEFKKTKKNNH